MIFLFFNVVLSSVMVLVFKISAQKGWNGDKIILVNYVVAAGMSLFSLLGSGQGAVLAGQEDGGAALFAKDSLACSITLGVATGLVQGGAYVLDLTVRSASIAQNGAGLTTFFSKSTFAVTIIISALVWRELPTALQWGGIALIIAALVLTTADLKTLKARKPLLFLLLVATGTLIEVTSKAVAVYVWPQHNSLFLTVVFSTALVICIVKNLWAKAKTGERLTPARPELALGVLFGITNMLVAWTHLKALGALPASVVFPTQAAGNLLLVFLLGRVFFHEDSSKRLVLSLGIAVAGLVLINL